MPHKPLTFIDLIQPDNGHTSCISINGNRKDSDKLKIVGGLNHGDCVIPKTVQDADKLILWLQEWKKSQEKPKHDN